MIIIIIIKWVPCQNCEIVKKFYADDADADTRKSIKVQMKCFFFIAEFERVAEIRKIAVNCFLISLLVPEL